MQKKYLIALVVPVALLAALVAASCNTAPKKSGQQHVQVFPAAYAYNKLEGIYSGDFGGSMLHMSLRKVTGRNVVGYTIYKGNKRNFSGIIEAGEGGFHLQLKEPGNDPHDGMFNVILDTNNMGMKGSWLPRRNKDMAPINFTLEQKAGVDEYENTLVYYDSINTITFSRDGRCVYDFYPVANGVVSSQMVTLRGSWQEQDNTYYVEFAKSQYLDGTAYIMQKDSVRQDSTSEYYHHVIKFKELTLSRGEY